MSHRRLWALGAAVTVALGLMASPSAQAGAGDVQPAANFTNPILWQDFADIDILRVDNTYYYSASTMHYSPGAPILRSYDLVNWEFAGHSVPRLDFGAKYDLNGGRGYVRGIWASFLNYRKSNKTFYWGGCIDFGQTHIYTATAVDGQWSRHTTINKCYYDAGMLVDDNDTMYVAYGNSNISVAQLSPDGKTEVRSQQVFTTPLESTVRSLKRKRTVAWLLGVVCALAVFPAVARADNPLVQHIYTADPAPMLYNGRVYLYTGHDEDGSTEPRTCSSSSPAPAAICST
ncbi:hypothetical protein JOF56_008538 [Kibdelosporangium banguiense]|uniref:Glycosyl hydrolases family 43 n=1 Tax=Kibdelosporangium banguiense TaxID=1365924 RepID=A0ABS4TUV4_9PSEU|nr:family 43 glycosylhydrolase [Kibdelosporangium banguiense]MBP2328153.1 hypothetical protein [Kibdelosporangium banguiense]